MSHLLLFQLFDGDPDDFFYSQTMEKRRVDHGSHKTFPRSFRILGPVDYFDDRDVKLGGKGMIPLIICRNRHDRTCTIIDQYILTDIDREGISCEWMAGICACEFTRHTFLSHSLDVGPALYVFDIFFDFLFLLRSRDFSDPLVFRGKDHKCRTEYRIRPGGINFEGFVMIDDVKIYRRTRRFSDPVILHRL